MTIEEAKQIFERNAWLDRPDVQEKGELITALETLIRETGEYEWMMELAGLYVADKQYDKAVKYYEMAFEHGCDMAAENLGTLYYYGRTGKPDYAKAMEYCTKAAEAGSINALVRMSDMYKNGYGVKRNPEEAVKMLEKACELVKDTEVIDDPLPEVFTRLARFRRAEDKIDEAIELYEQAKGFLAGRLLDNPVFADLNTMEWLVTELYDLKEPDAENLDLFDLYWLLKKPSVYALDIDETQYVARAVGMENETAVLFEGKRYDSPGDFLQHAMISGERLVQLWEQINIFPVSQADCTVS